VSRFSRNERNGSSSRHDHDRRERSGSSDRHEYDRRDCRSTYEADGHIDGHGKQVEPPGSGRRMYGLPEGEFLEIYASPTRDDRRGRARSKEWRDETDRLWPAAPVGAARYQRPEHYHRS
jgi:hypothetical protein